MPLTARQLRQLPTIEAIGRVPYFADASTDSKEKRIIRIGLDINSKVDIYLYRLKCSLYNILTLNKVLKNPV